jgi:hypothetical protein
VRRLTATTARSHTESLAFEFDVPHAPEKVWRALRLEDGGREARRPAREDAMNHEEVSMSPKKRSKGFTAEERAAMKERAQELRTGKADGESAVLAKIAAMPEPDRTLGKRLHAIIKANAPDLAPRLWYGMPAYAKPGKNGKVVCFFQDAKKFKSRYATFGFSDQALLDDGHMWPTAFALTELTAADEARIGALVKQAVAS